MKKLHDWKLIISDLIDSGFSEASLAAVLGTSQPNVNRIKNGTTIKVEHSLGEHILKLHNERFRNAA